MSHLGFDMSEFLAHEYDPVKAKEYYERTKKLKGRNKGAAVAVVDKTKALATTAAVKKSAAPTPVKSTGKRAAELKARLGRLEEVLNTLEMRVKAAQARSGITSQVKKSTDTKKSAESASKEPAKKTSSQKKADSKAAKERYEKNKDPETSKNAQAVQDEIEEVQKKIAEAREELQAALAKLRTSSSKPKPKLKPVKTDLVRNKEGDRQNGA